CAVSAQAEFEQANRGDLPEPLLVRMSIHLGDIVVRDEDIFGDTVNVASHLQAVTPGGAICVSKEVYTEVRGKISGDFKNLGFCKIRGLPEPIEVFRVIPKSQNGRITTPFSPRPVTAMVIAKSIGQQNNWWIAAAGFLMIASALAAWFYHH